MERLTLSPEITSRIDRARYAVAKNKQSELEAKTRTIQSIRYYSEAQVPLWKTVPYICISASRRHPSKVLELARNHHLWLLEERVEKERRVTQYDFLLDLDTGKLVVSQYNVFSHEFLRDRLVNAPDEYVYSLTKRIDMIDARKVIKTLQDLSK